MTPAEVACYVSCTLLVASLTKEQNQTQDLIQQCVKFLQENEFVCAQKITDLEGKSTNCSSVHPNMWLNARPKLFFSFFSFLVHPFKRAIVMTPLLTLATFLLRPISQTLSKSFTSDLEYLFIIKMGIHFKGTSSWDSYVPFLLRISSHQQSSHKVECTVLLTALDMIFYTFSH